MDMLRVSGVSKSFGENKVVEALSFSVPENTIYGFIGENGAGKTTTMRMMLGLLQTDSGEIFINGEKVRYGQNETNQYIGYLPDVPEFYGYMTPMEYLTLCGEITEMPKEQVKAKAKELLKLVGLEYVNKRIQHFSRGMKQRLGIAQALLNSPKLLICDEPTSALDPVGRKEILDILHQVKDSTTVIFSTHILSDVERICDEIAVLHQGKIAFQGTFEDIKKNQRSTGFEIEFYQERDADFVAEKLAGSQRNTRTQMSFPNKTAQEMSAAMLFLAENQIFVQRIEMQEATLENLFMEVIGK